MYSFLDGFEERMELVGIVESIVNRKNKNMELERLFQGADFVNLVFSVLLYIMEKTLSEDSDCDIDNIGRFIETILPLHYNIHLDKGTTGQLADYIIKNVLQNEGTPYHFQAVDYSKDTRRNIPIRLITDNVLEGSGGYRIIYSLTDQGYNFLFRTKEVDQEIKMTIEELKLKELIKRKNFSKALSQSQNLIQMVRQKKREIQLFISKVKENIHNVDIDEYEKLISSTYELLNEEYDLLNEIMEMSKRSEEKIRMEYEESHKLDESLKKAQHEIKQINNNIMTTLSEQRDLILSRQNLSKVYIDTLADSFIYNLESRYDFEEVILKQMEKHIDKVESFWKLVNPLFLPNVNKNLNIRSVYEPQGMLKLGDEEKIDYIEEEELSEDTEKLRIERVNEIYTLILEYILSYLFENCREKKYCTFEDIIGSLKSHEDGELFENLTADRLLFTTIMKLYDIGTIDISRWRLSDNKFLENPSEEFNLEYCLWQLMDKHDFIKKISSLEVLKQSGQYGSGEKDAEEKASDLLHIEITRSDKDGFAIVESVEITNFIFKLETS